ncbi:MAG: DUF4340 domain-containing protein, partial [Planctomycetota bacterium]|nr:DUF4340 domain-containing protein [Planctomycetota bacterium]
FELVEAVDGETRTFRVEIGSVDFDGVTTFARVRYADEDLLLRIPRNLDTTLERFANDYRDRRATPIRARDVIAFRRTGALALEAGGATVDRTLDARLDTETGWISVNPRRAALDPVAIGLLVLGSAELRIDGFHADAPEALAHYGLEPPVMRVQLDTASGEVVVLRFGKSPGSGRWLCMREGYPFIFAVKERKVLLLAQPRELLYDHNVLRVRREDVRTIELSGNGRATRVDRMTLGRREGLRPLDDWTVRYATDPIALVHRADRGRVEDVLARMEHAQIEGFDEEREFPVLVAAADSVTVTTADGTRWGGELAPVPDLASGETRWLFRRYGDDVVGWVGLELAELARTSVEDLLSRDLVGLEWLSVVGLIVSRGGDVREFAREQERIAWNSRRSGFEAPDDLAELVEKLCVLRAIGWLEADEGVGEPIEVELVRDWSRRLPGPDLILVQRPDGLVECRTGDGLHAEVAPEIFGALQAFFE